MAITTPDNIPSTSGFPEKADGAIHSMSSSAHAAVNSLAEAADETARKAKPVIDRLSSKAHDAVDKAADIATPTADWLLRQGENLSAAHKRLSTDTCNYVSANPVKSVGIALLAGFLLSRIILK